MKKSLLITLIMVLFLAACAPVAPAPTPAAIQSTVETPAPVPTVAPTQAVQPTAAPTEAPAPTQTASPTLTENPWQWVAYTSPVDQFKIEQPESYQLTFQDDGTVAIKADCNNASGTYAADDSSLTIKVGPTTTAACPEGSRSEQLVKLLSGAATYFFVDNALFINLYADGGTMRFDPAGQTAASADSAAADQAAQAAAVAAALAGNPWKWAAFTSATEGVTVETPAKYMVTFKDDGTVEIKADCNNAFGTYALDGMNVTIEIGPATLAACPGASRSEQFLQLLGDAAQALPVEGKLYMPLKTEGSTLAFDAVITTVADLCGEKAPAINKIDDTLDPEISAALNQALISFLQAGSRSAPGVSMLIITPQGRYFKSTGVADAATCAPLPADSAYEIGSNTKMMTSAIIFQLQEEGVLATSDLLSEWLPDLAAVLPNGDQITIDMLLSHTSGLFDYFDVKASDGAIADGTHDKAMLARAFTPEELVKRVADSGESYFAPGAEGQWHYSNTGYILLGLLIEKATGKSYEENLRSRIFEPLGLKQTHLLTSQPKPGTLPHAYYQPPFDFTTDEWNASQGWAAGAVVSTPEEFAAFLKALFTGKLYKQASTLELMQQHTTAGVDALGRGTIYAHGMLDNHGVLGHGGQTLGFQSDGGYIPDKDVTIVMWSNSATSAVNRLAVPALAGIVLGQGTAATRGRDMASSGQTQRAAEKPSYVTALEAAYGAPSQAGFGSAVFFEPLKAGDDLKQAALAKYKHFVGELWMRYGEDAWMGRGRKSTRARQAPGLISWPN